MMDKRNQENLRRQTQSAPQIVHKTKKPEVPINQTIVSMLLKLYERYAKKLYEIKSCLKSFLT